MNTAMETMQTAVRDSSGSHVDLRTPSICTGTVYALFTTLEDTGAAVNVAGDFATALGVPVTVVHVRTVPYPLPLNRPDGISPIEMAAFNTCLEKRRVDLQKKVLLCRSDHEVIPMAFRTPSLIVVAGRRRWWPTASARWRRALEEAGHFVVFVDTTEHREYSHA